MTALGFIETKGLLAAIEAADAMVKAADVRLIEKNLIGAGLVTITIAGEVSAVQASVEAAATAVKRIEGAVLVSKHVIARPYEEVSHIIATQDLSTEPETSPVVEGKVEVPAKTETEEHLEIEAAPGAEMELPHYTISELKKMTVNMLRHISLGLSDIALTNEEIKAATKKKLIEAIFNVTNR